MPTHYIGRNWTYISYYLSYAGEVYQYRVSLPYSEYPAVMDCLLTLKNKNMELCAYVHLLL